jgi:hypothetical protein
MKAGRIQPPIINFGRFRIDWPSRERTLVENLRFVGFVIVLLLIISLLTQMQFRWLTQRNARSAIPTVPAANGIR